MEEEGTVSTVNGSDLIEAGAAPTVNTAPSPIESTVPAEDPSPTAGVDGPSTGPEEGVPQGLSSVTAREVSSIGAETTDSARSARAQVVRISGIKEIGRDGKTSKITFWKPEFQIEKGLEASFAEIYERVESLRDPLHAIPLPTGTAQFGSAIELFGRLRNAIAEQALVPAPTSALLKLLDPLHLVQRRPGVRSWACSRRTRPRGRLGSARAPELLSLSFDADAGRYLQFAKGQLG